jgi:copper chaperone CopZ
MGVAMKIIWRRLLTNPMTRIESIDGGVVQLRVDGLVCSNVCAARTKQALRRIDGVRRVSVDFEGGIDTIEGTPADAETYERAVTGVVRRLVERVARRLEHVRSPAKSDDGREGLRT